MFAHDLIVALDRAEQSSRRRPHFNEKRWSRCLAEADQHDSARAYRAKCDAQLAQEFRTHVRYYQYLPGDAIPRMNGKRLHWQASDPEIRTLAQINAAQG
jgi:hypothetical protein